MLKKIFFCITLSGPMWASISLIEAYQKALLHDHSFLSHQYEIHATLERVNQAKAQFYPNIEFSSFYNGEFYDKDNKSIDESYISNGLTLRQPIYKPGLQLREDKASLKAKGAATSLELTKQELARKVTEAYLKVLYAKEGLVYAEANHAMDMAKYQQVETSLSMGLSNKMDLLEAKVRADQSQAEISEFTKSIELAKLELWRLIGEKIDIFERDLSQLDLSFFRSLSIKQFEAKIVNNLEVKHAMIEQLIAEKEQKERESEYEPVIDLQLSASNLDYVDDAFKDERKKREIRLNFTYPLYQGGYRESRIKESILLLKAAHMKVLDSKRDVRVRFEKAVTDFTKALDIYEINIKSEEHAEVYIEAIQRGYNEGLKNLVELLDAKSRYFQIKRDKLKTALNLSTSYLELLSLVGDISIPTVKQLDQALGH